MSRRGDRRAGAEFDGGIITRLDCVVFGIVVNKHAQRFYDEGEDIWPKRYAIWGRLVAAQPDQIAYIVFDAKSLNLFMPSLFPPIRADNIRELGANSALTPMPWKRPSPGSTGPFSPVPSTTRNWTTAGPGWADTAQIALGPGDRQSALLRVPGSPGITFTYLGTRVDKRACILMEGGKPSANMFAAGDHGRQCPWPGIAGIEMTIGSVFGRVAGRRPPHTLQLSTTPDATLPDDTRDDTLPAGALREAGRLMTVCNSCRYCEGLCAVFRDGNAPDLTSGDLNYLANLCHNCSACYYDCQFSPPHEFDVNVLACWRRCGRNPIRPTPGPAPSPAHSSATD